MRRSLLVALLLVVVAPAAARADFQQDYQQEIEAARQLLGTSVDRARRAIAFGPHIGGFGGLAISPSEGLGGLSFGLALYTFDIPTVLDARAVFEEAIKTRVEARFKAIVTAGAPVPTRDEIAQIAREVLAEVKAELFGDRTGKALEKPSLGVIVEGVRLMGLDGWQARLGLSKGLGPVSVGIGGGYQYLPGDHMPLLGAEVSLRLTPIGAQRTPVFDVYTRFDVGFGNEDRTTTTIIGLRALVDAI